MSTIVLADKNKCTACGVCVQICPKHAISMQLDALDCIYPHIEPDRCVGCRKCVNTCPALQSSKHLNMPISAYAAWSADSEIRRQAASGGIASAIYSHCLKNGIKTYGVYYAPKGKATYIPVCNKQDIEKCRNSKYVFSDITPVLEDIKNALAAGQRVILPGLPCQLAAVREYLGQVSEGLTLVDIVCHGVCPEAYLNQHIAGIETRKNKMADQVFFRDPKYGTHQFYFSLIKNGKSFYHKKVYANDEYQLGYHKALNYRKNCYHCIYARPKRIGDMTISDFSGLGRLKPFDRERKSVSCVLVNTPKGRLLMQQLSENGLVETEERPLEEALKYEKQLQTPSVAHAHRSIFEEKYRCSGNYDTSAKQALCKDIWKNNVCNALHWNYCKTVVAKILPAGFKKQLKKVGKKDG